MSGPELKRCFECGATYPVAELVCPSDKTPLSFDTVGRRWKVQALIGLRPGGAVFEATHLIHGTRAALDLLPGSNAREVDFESRMQRQLQALRLLDKNKHILPLIEDGTERDGSRFFVTELLAARRLAEAGELPVFHDGVTGVAECNDERDSIDRDLNEFHAV